MNKIQNILLLFNEIYQAKLPFKKTFSCVVFRIFFFIIPFHVFFLFSHLALTWISSSFFLSFSFNYEQCEPGLGASVMYNLLYNKPQKLMLLAGCSTVCTTVAEAAKMWNLIVVSKMSLWFKYDSFIARLLNIHIQYKVKWENVATQSKTTTVVYVSWVGTTHNWVHRQFNKQKNAFYLLFREWFL